MSSYAVEFVGGPFDGYKHEVSFLPDELATTVTLPVNGNVLRMLDGERRGPRAPATSVAIYELENTESTWKYQYLGATSAKQLQLEDWQV
jgi:hypothetical protein